MGYKVALVGATGNVGREMLNILDERKFPADEVVALASRRSVGVEVSYGDRTLKCKALEHYDFSDIDICLMSAGGAVSKEWSPKIGAAGAVVIDNSSAWRMDPDVPLIVPEVNADAVAGFTSDVCVYATVLSAYDLGFHVYALREGMVGFFDGMADQMVNFVYPMWSQVIDNDDFDKMIEAAPAAARKASAQ